MKVKVHNLKDGETSFQFQSDRDGWVKAVSDRMAKLGAPSVGPLEVELRITKLDPDYYLQGVLKSEVEQTCSRCAEVFQTKSQHPFEVAFARVSRNNLKDADAAGDSDETDVNFFDGEEIDLMPIVEEQFQLSLPYKPLCQTDCKGICQVCGRNLNLGTCSCKNSESASPFSVLQNIKV